MEIVTESIVPSIELKNKPVSKWISRISDSKDDEVIVSKEV